MVLMMRAWYFSCNYVLFEFETSWTLRETFLMKTSDFRGNWSKRKSDCTCIFSRLSHVQHDGGSYEFQNSWPICCTFVDICIKQYHMKLVPFKSSRDRNPCWVVGGDPRLSTQMIWAYFKLSKRYFTGVLFIQLLRLRKSVEFICF